MKNLWNSGDDRNMDPLKLDEVVEMGSLVRFTHFPSFNSFVGIYLGVEVIGGKVKWRFATDGGLKRVDPKGLSHCRLDLV